MTYAQYSIIPYFIISALLLATAALILQLSQFYRSICIELPKSQFEPIDGLRGYLALAVLYHHAIINQHYFQTWNWEANNWTFYPSAARWGVLTFFMITGFLFWNKVIKTEGKINIQSFYTGRLKRLAPAYFASISLLIIIAFAYHNFHPMEGRYLLTKSILPWFAFGVLETGDINQYPHTSHINADVIWTLAYEWKFYLALPFISIAWRGYSFLVMLTLMYTYGMFIEDIGMIRFFAYGMAAAFFLNKFDMKNLFRSKAFSIIAMLLLIGAFFVQPSSRQFLFFLFFVIVAGGNSLFSLFTNAPAKLLGTISYSVYLFHGIVLFIVMHGINRFLRVADLNEIHFWMVTAMCGLLTVILSSITYRFIEHPFIHR